MLLHAWMGIKTPIKSISSLCGHLSLGWLGINHQDLIFKVLNASKSSKGQLLWTNSSKTQRTSSIGPKCDIIHPETISKHEMVKDGT